VAAECIRCFQWSSTDLPRKSVVLVSVGVLPLSLITGVPLASMFIEGNGILAVNQRGVRLDRLLIETQ
jgi:hypothetical protein